MTRLFNEKGQSVVCTVIEAEPNVVVQVKNLEKDGYRAIQTGAVQVKEAKIKRVSKPLKGHFSKAQVQPRQRLAESPVPEGEEYAVGQEIGVDYFSETPYVDVTATTKGKGFQGVMKRHGFKGGPASHGSGFHRSPGSTGMCSNPGRTLPGLKMAGHMGAVKKTVESLEVIRVDREKGVILVKGAVPGSRGSLVYVRKSKKRKHK